MDRASALDSAFLQIEDAHSSLHIASVAIFEGPPPSQEAILEAIGRRLALAPRLRQRLLAVPFGLGRPVWADDPDFDLRRHVRRVGVPAPGGDEQLHDVVDTILSEHLDHELPLWEDVVIDGLPDDRWALVTKVHHTMADGIAGTDLLSTILETTPRPRRMPQPVPWSPPPRPGRTRLLAGAVRDQALLRARELRSASASIGGALHPRTLADTAVQTGRGLLGYAEAGVPLSPSSLVGPLGSDRSFRWTEADLGEVLRAHSRLGGTVNDLVLAVVTHAFRALLLARGEEPAPNAVRCLVPVSVRSEGARGVLDNQVSALLATLPVELEDARDRLNEVAIRMRALKSSHEADAGERLIRFADALPPAAVTGFLHLAFRTPHRNLTTVTTNVPGPTRQLFLAGRPMLTAYPFVPIADRLRLGVAVTTYQGRLLFGVTCDRQSTPDVAVFVAALDAALAELLSLARVSQPKGVTP
ncbi:wax ester/triacylglycerol synthase family O-acyltransferase [Nocardioides sp.]|uniref:wax ester/triacylglycerol synthase family O-acyltransferase n=1 Tax=Nocardioides sp. TaxID=35761 RepID=UPI003D0A6E71